MKCTDVALPRHVIDTDPSCAGLLHDHERETSDSASCQDLFTLARTNGQEQYQSKSIGSPALASLEPIAYPVVAERGHRCFYSFGYDAAGSKHYLVSPVNVASVIGNHSVPVLQWLTLEHITFAVLPYLDVNDPTNCYSYEDVGDVLKNMIQMLEAVTFCHSKLVAHLDLFEGNFLCNYRGGLGVEMTMLHVPGERAPLFRSLYPFMIYLIDFDTAVCFDVGTDPATHRITGLPPNVAAAYYNRPKCPEMTMDVPYCPFLADVWQLGTTFQELRLDLSALPQPVRALIDRMTSENPSDRPSSAAALKELRNIVFKMETAELRAYVPI